MAKPRFCHHELVLSKTLTVINTPCTMTVDHTSPLSTTICRTLHVPSLYGAGVGSLSFFFFNAVGSTVITVPFFFVVRVGRNFVERKVLHFPFRKSGDFTPFILSYSWYVKTVSPKVWT